MKSKVGKLDVDKLLPLPVDVSKLTVTVKNDVVKTVATKTAINAVENEIPSIGNLNKCY